MSMHSLKLEASENQIWKADPEPNAALHLQRTQWSFSAYEGVVQEVADQYDRVHEIVSMELVTQTEWPRTHKFAAAWLMYNTATRAFMNQIWKKYHHSDDTFKTVVCAAKC